jgi:ribosome-associated toxin RatA of RatAB toxin-antitoxin module
MRALFCLFFCAGQLYAADALPSPIEIHTAEQDGHIVLNAQFSARVSKALAFTVLTDFDHMAEFLPNMAFSKITSRNAQHLTVKQQGQLQIGFISVMLDSEREIELKPSDEINARSINSTNGTFKSQMLITQPDQDSIMMYHADWQPQSALLGNLGKNYLQEQIHQQFGAMQKEMLRRAKIQLASAPQAR